MLQEARKEVLQSDAVAKPEEAPKTSKELTSGTRCAYATLVGVILLIPMVVGTVLRFTDIQTDSTGKVYIGKWGVFGTGAAIVALWGLVMSGSQLLSSQVEWSREALKPEAPVLPPDGAWYFPDKLPQEDFGKYVGFVKALIAFGVNVSSMTLAVVQLPARDASATNGLTYLVAAIEFLVVVSAFVIFLGFLLRFVFAEPEDSDASWTSYMFNFVSGFSCLMLLQYLSWEKLMQQVDWLSVRLKMNYCVSVIAAVLQALILGPCGVCALILKLSFLGFVYDRPFTSWSFSSWLSLLAFINNFLGFIGCISTLQQEGIFLWMGADHFLQMNYEAQKAWSVALCKKYQNKLRAFVVFRSIGTYEMIRMLNLKAA